MQLTSHLEKLVFFEAVCRLKSFSSAAAELARSQPAVSRAIKELEAVVGMQLLRRSNRAVVLTKVGEDLYAASQDILRSVHRFERTLSTVHGPLETVSVGTKEPIAVHVWAEFSAWCKRSPGQFALLADLERVVLKIEKSNTKLTQAFNEHDLDFLIVPPDARISRSATTVKLLPTFWEPFIAQSYDGPVQNAPLILYEQTLVGEKLRLQDVLDSSSYKAPILRVNSLGAAMALCARGFGATILPRWMAVEEVRRGTIVPFRSRDSFPLTLPDPSHIIVAYWKDPSRRETVLRIAKALQGFCRQHYA